jgi:uncharacterized protein YkwD
MRRGRLALWMLLLLAAPLTGCGLAAEAIVDAIEDGGGGGGGGGGSDNGEEMSNGELALAAEVFALVNTERAAENLPPLVWHDTMADVAYDHALDMDERNFFDHENPDGEEPSDRLLDRGLSFTFVAENIAEGVNTPAAAMALWMGSDGHKANILSPLVTQLGVGVHQTATGTWWVQLFRSP